MQMGVETDSVKQRFSSLIEIKHTSGFATTHVDILSLIDLPTPYQSPKYVKDSYWRE